MYAGRKLAAETNKNVLPEFLLQISIGKTSNGNRKKPVKWAVREH